MLLYNSVLFVFSQLFGNAHKNAVMNEEGGMRKHPSPKGIFLLLQVFQIFVSADISPLPTLYFPATCPTLQVAKSWVRSLYYCLSHRCTARKFSPDAWSPQGGTPRHSHPPDLFPPPGHFFFFFF